MSIVIILQQMLVIAVLAAVGFFAFRHGILDEHVTKKLSTIVVDICNPALAISCVIQDRINATHRDVLQALLIALAIYMILILMGIVLPKLICIPKAQQKFYQMMAVYANIGFIGIPVAKAILDPDAMIYVIIFNVMFSVLFYTHGMYVMGNRKKDEAEKKKWRVNVGFLCGILTILIFWFDVTIPELLGEIIVYIGNATTFLSMSLLGASFAVASFREIFRGKKMFFFVLLRQLCIPLLFGKILLLWDINTNMVYAFTLLLAMPAANMPLMLAERNGEDTSVLSQGILLTTILLPVTMTLVLGLL